jgi:MFS family permease
LIAVVEFNATPMQTGLLASISGLAFALFALPAGVVADLLPKRQVLITCDILRCALIGSIPLLWHLHALDLAVIYAASFSVNGLTVLFDIAYQSYLTILIDRRLLVNATSKLQASWYLSYLAGNSLGSALIAGVGIVLAVLGDAITFVASVAALIMISFREVDLRSPAQDDVAAKRSFRADIIAGLSFVYKHPMLRWIVAANATCNFGMTIANGIGAIYAIRILHVAPRWLGILFGSAIVGGAIGSAAAAKLISRFGIERMLWAPLALFGWLSLPVAFATPRWGLALYVIGWFGNALVTSIYGTSQASYCQLACPPALLGRVNASVRWVTLGVAPLGGVIGGVIATSFGPRAAMAAAMAATPLAGIWLVLARFRHDGGRLSSSAS